MGGDRVKCCTANGKVSVNGRALDEPYLYPGDPASTVPFDLTVPKGRLWVMGDHHQVSRDSSRHMNDPGGGTIPADRVVGRAFVRMWPLDRIGGLGVPATFHGLGLGREVVSVPAGSAPATLGFVGAVPVTVLRRRRKLRSAAAAGR